MAESKPKCLDELPDIMLLDIFEWLSYEDVSKIRLVSVRFNELGQFVLNSGFNKVIKEHNVMLKSIKSQLPRRESERRTHSLARHSDILTSIETRISMLSMTYNRYIDLRLCAFIPGRVLDEIRRILRVLKVPNRNLRPHEILQELRDISSMAIEHFDEKIAPNLKKTYADNGVKSGSSVSVSVGGVTIPNNPTNLRGNTNFANLMLSNASSVVINRLTPTFMTSGTLRDRAALYQASYQSSHNQCVSMSYVLKLESDYKKGVAKLQQMQVQNKVQNRRLQDAVTCIGDLKQLIADVKRRQDEMENKYRELLDNSEETVEVAELKNDTPEPKIMTRKRRKQALDVSTSDSTKETPATTSEESALRDGGTKKPRID